MKKFTRLVCLFALLNLTATPLFAEEYDLIDANYPEDILQIAKGYGQATLEKDSDGDPKIAGKIDGVKFGIYFYGCNNHVDCKDIQFSASWSGAEKIELSTINKFNNKRRYGKAHRSDSGTMTLEMPVELQYGVTTSNLESWFDRWKAALSLFDKDVLKAP